MIFIYFSQLYPQQGHLLQNSHIAILIDAWTALISSSSSCLLIIPFRSSRLMTSGSRHVFQPARLNHNLNHKTPSSFRVAGFKALLSWHPLAQGLFVGTLTRCRQRTNWKNPTRLRKKYQIFIRIRKQMPGTKPAFFMLGGSKTRGQETP